MEMLCNSLVCNPLQNKDCGNYHFILLFHLLLKQQKLSLTYLYTLVWTFAVWAAHILQWTPCSGKFLCLQGHWCKCATQWKEPVAIKQISLPFPSKVSLSCPWLRLIEHKFSFIWILNINTKQFVSKLIAWLRFNTIQLSLNASVWSNV